MNQLNIDPVYIRKILKENRQAYFLKKKNEQKIENRLPSQDDFYNCMINNALKPKN